MKRKDLLSGRSVEDSDNEQVKDKRFDGFH